MDIQPEPIAAPACNGHAALLAATLANAIEDLPPFGGVRVVADCAGGHRWRLDIGEGTVEIAADLTVAQARSALEAAYDAYLAETTIRVNGIVLDPGQVDHSGFRHIPDATTRHNLRRRHRAHSDQGR